MGREVKNMNKKLERKVAAVMGNRACRVRGCDGEYFWRQRKRREEA